MAAAAAAAFVSLSTMPIMAPCPWAAPEGTPAAGGLYTPGGFENTEKKIRCTRCMAAMPVSALGPCLSLSPAAGAAGGPRLFYHAMMPGSPGPWLATVLARAESRSESSSIQVGAAAAAAGAAAGAAGTQAAALAP